MSLTTDDAALDLVVLDGQAMDSDLRERTRLDSPDHRHGTTDQVPTVTRQAALEAHCP